MPSDAEIAAEVLNEEASLRFVSFRTEDAVTIGMNLRKRFRSSAKHARGRGAVLMIQTIQGTPLFACAIGAPTPSFPLFPTSGSGERDRSGSVGGGGPNNSTSNVNGPSYYGPGYSYNNNHEGAASPNLNPIGGTSLGGLGGLGAGSGLGTTLIPPESGPSPDTWARLEAIMRVSARTGHSSFYVEKGRQVLGKSAGELGLPFPEYRIEGGAFPIWLVNAPTTPLAIIGLYSGNSMDDHTMIVSTLRHFFVKSGPNASGIHLSARDLSGGGAGAAGGSGQEDGHDL